MTESCVILTFSVPMEAVHDLVAPTCMHAYIYVRIYIYVCIYMYMYVHMYRE